jgi:NhaP-type Na+/H+ or K+/H+ antiporter
MIWCAGIRGAMAFACAKTFPDTNGNQPVVETATMMIVLVTLFGYGTTTIPLLEYLGIPVRPSVSGASASVGWGSQYKRIPREGH